MQSLLTNKLTPTDTHTKTNIQHFKHKNTKTQKHKNTKKYTHNHRQSCTQVVPVNSSITIADNSTCSYVNTNCQAEQCWWACRSVFDCGQVCAISTLPPSIVNCAGYVSTRVFASISVISAFIALILGFLIIANRQPSTTVRSFGMAMMATFIFGMIAWAVSIGTNYNANNSNGDSITAFYNMGWAQIIFITGTVLAFLVGGAAIAMAGSVKSNDNNNNMNQNPNNNQMEMQQPKQQQAYGEQPPSYM